MEKENFENEEQKPVSQLLTREELALWLQCSVRQIDTLWSESEILGV